MPVDKTYPIIDAWAQPALANALKKLPEIARLFKQSGSSHLLETGLTAEQIVEEMDRAGIKTMMLSAWHRPGQWVFHNDQIAEMTRRFPDRFAGIAAVNLEKPVEAVRELDRAVNELGFKALRVVPWLWNRPPNDKFYFPRYYPPQLIYYLKTYGKEKVLFGTNFPQLSLEKCVQQVEDLGLPDEAKENFLFRNAQRVFTLVA